jgi:uncharacterized repeat protein (TIGR03843 family)
MLSIEEKTSILDILTNGEMKVEGQFAWGSNFTLLCNVIHNGENIPAVYKPARGERPLWDFPEESLGKRETAAYLISEAGGWHMVPPTVYRSDAPEGEGSLQYFIPHDPEVTYFNLSDAEKLSLKPVALFDAVINNTDRKGGHILRDKEMNYWLIDHGVSFHQMPKLRTVVWDFAGLPIPGSLLGQISALKDKFEIGSELSKNILDYISTEELQAMQQRIDHLLDTGLFPVPGEEVSPYPWPPV